MTRSAKASIKTLINDAERSLGLFTQDHMHLKHKLQPIAEYLKSAMWLMPYIQDMPSTPSNINPWDLIPEDAGSQIWDFYEQDKK